MTNKWIAVVAISGLWLSCKPAAPDRQFAVSGTIKNTASKMVYLEELQPGAQPLIMDSAQLKPDGSFALKATSAEESLYQLRLQQMMVPLGLIISDVPAVTVAADTKAGGQPCTVKGSAATDALVRFDSTTFSTGLRLFVAGSKVDSLVKAGTPDSAVNVAYTDVATLAAQLKTTAQEAVAASSSPVLALYIMNSFQATAKNMNIEGFSKTEQAQMVAAAAAKFPAHKALQAVKKSLPSAMAADFSQPDSAGNAIKLSSFRGKYVLLDFWASWCAPCRRENPNVVAAYNRFKDKPFTVFSVSLDRNRAAWLQAIQQDGLTWAHASDLKFWSNEAAVLYNVQSIPANFLIDPQGNVIAENLQGEELVRVLEKVLK